MALQAEVRFEGMEDVRRGLRRLEDSARASTLEGAIRRASEPIIRSAKAKAPSPTIARGLRVVNVLTKQEGEIKSEVGLPGGPRDWFYGLFYELGTGPRRTKGRGPVQFVAANRGSMPARPFLRPALDEQTPAARRIFAAELRKAIEGAARG